MAFSTETRIKVITDVQSGKFTVAEAAVLNKVSEQSIRNWLADPKLVSIAMSGDKDIAEVTKPVPPSNVKYEVAAAIYCIAKNDEKLATYLCRKNGVHLSEIRDFGRQHDAYQQFEHASVIDLQKREKAARANELKLKSRLAEMTNSFNEVLSAVKKVVASSR